MESQTDTVEEISLKELSWQLPITATKNVKKNWQKSARKKTNSNPRLSVNLMGQMI